MSERKEQFWLGKIVPVVVLGDADRAPELATALRVGGMISAEITMRTPAALETIRRMCQSEPELIVGAGTVLDEKMARQAIEAGAKFLVSPGLDPDVLELTRQAGIPMFPGVATATEVIQAQKLGVEQMKFFPAEQIGGIRALKALAAPFPTVRFMPTGGIDPNNVKDYLELPNVVACGGSWICPRDLVESGDFEEVTRRCRAALNSVNS